MSSAKLLVTHLLSLSLLMAASVQGQEPSPRVPPRSRPEITVTRQPLFSIQFYLNPKSALPSAVRLYVSGDLGQTWQLYQQRLPNEGHFDFHAGDDGEYWFAVRTSADRPPTPSTTPPEKIIRVDRQQPELSLRVTVGSTGELIAAWEAMDTNLEPNSFRLQYQISSNDPWQPVSHQRRVIDESDPSPRYQDQVSWAVAQQSGRVKVRAEIFDRAGNSREAEQEVDLSSAAVAKDKPTLVDEIPSWRDEAFRQETADPVAPWQSRASSPNGGALEAGWRSPGQPAPDPPQEAGLPEVVRPGSQDDPSSTGKSNGSPPSDGTWRPDSPDDPTRPVESSAAGYQPPVASRGQDLPTPSRSDVPLTNSRQFNLDYEIRDVEDGGVERVELWVTDDYGGSWKPYGTDDDRVSPFFVEMDREGIFGFRLLIHNRAGLSAPPPKSGDQADLMLGIDTTPPAVKLIATELLSDSTPPRVRIRWRAEDPNLAERPVRLSYAPRPTGPWSYFVDALDNRGAYDWTPETPLPRQTYIRLEVTDRAGNLATDQSTAPVSDTSREPRAIIRRFEPVGKTP